VKTTGAGLRPPDRQATGNAGTGFRPPGRQTTEASAPQGNGSTAREDSAPQGNGFDNGVSAPQGNGFDNGVSAPQGNGFDDRVSAPPRQRVRRRGFGPPRQRRRVRQRVTTVQRQVTTGPLRATARVQRRGFGPSADRNARRARRGKSDGVQGMDTCAFVLEENGHAAGENGGIAAGGCGQTHEGRPGGKYSTIYLENVCMSRGNGRGS
jgi:hypothetical protein